MILYSNGIIQCLDLVDLKIKIEYELDLMSLNSNFYFVIKILKYIALNLSFTKMMWNEYGVLILII